MGIWGTINFFKNTGQKEMKQYVFYSEKTKQNKHQDVHQQVNKWTNSS